jgi:hypothetical protein
MRKILGEKLMRPLPIGIQTFEDLIRGSYLYIDKTKSIYKLIKDPKGVYFLSRPRRFGKSLLISTLEAIFKGKKELFKDLWIENSDYKWQELPIIRIDFASIPNYTGDVFVEGIRKKLFQIAKAYGKELEEIKEIKLMFEELIKKLASVEKVVILIDEYDKPIIDNIKNLKVAKKNRNILKSFYGTIKSSDEYLRFVFLTGISKFSKVSIFSDLNNLNDISMNNGFSTILGYTQEEMEKYFKKEILALGRRENKNKPEILKEIKDTYNGYMFSEESERVYNPFSTLLLFYNMKFKNYWFETATPTFLIELIKEKGEDIKEIEREGVDELMFSSYEIEDLKVKALLYQTGYITIKRYEKKRRLYWLGYPNYEVKQAFLKYLAESFSKIKVESLEGYIWKIIDTLEAKDCSGLIENLKIFFANIPYDIQLTNEKYYQTVFYLIFTILGLKVKTEVRTNQGRIDACVELEDKVYIFEFKLQDSAKKALAQIKEKKYYEKYLGEQKQIVLLGVSFDQEERNIGDWKAEEFLR